ncbi:MAG: type II secretion system protein [Clostridia bacterium]
MKIKMLGKQGFSFIELVVVIAIMAVLAGVVSGALIGQKQKSEDSIAATEAANILNTCKDIYSNHILMNRSNLSFTVEDLCAELKDDYSGCTFDEAGPSNSHKYKIELRKDGDLYIRYIDITFLSKRAGKYPITKTLDLKTIADLKS